MKGEGRFHGITRLSWTTDGGGPVVANKVLRESYGKLGGGWVTGILQTYSGESSKFYFDTTKIL